MPKKNLIFLTAILALVAIASVLYDGSGGGVKDPRVNKELFAEADLPKIKGLEISKGDKKVVVEEGEGRRWHMADATKFPVNVSKVISFVETASKVKPSRLVSNSKEQAATYEVDHGTQVVLKGANGPLLDLTLGKRKEGGGQYLRFAGSNNIYLIDNELAVDLESSDWELKTLTHIEKDGLKMVTFVHGEGAQQKTLTLTKDKKEDKFKIEGLTDKEQIKESELTAIDNNLRAFAYSRRHPKDNGELAAAVAKGPKIEVQTFTGDKITLRVGEVVKKIPPKEKKDKPQDEKKYYLVMTFENEAPAEAEKVKFYKEFLDPWIFEIEAYQFKWFEKNREDFVEPKKSS